ncbi:hypothetical protein HJFPF1_00593 [Paramyrothecium foliicola]|nr:hypothetical protein HJFPF1_00593 [Paramyrothecium foliicola]
MPAPAESTMSGGNAVDNSRLDQPSDAVAMKAMPSSPEGPGAAQPSDAADAVAVGGNAAAEPLSSTNEAVESQRPEQAESTPQAQAKSEGADVAADAPAVAPPPPIKERQDSGMAIGPAQDDISIITPGGSDGPVCNITLLLTTGSRHPYKLDGKYLSRRNVTIPEQTESGQPDPFSISIYTLKELILREWRSDWEAKPASPSSIRLIHFGKLLDDKEPLRKYQFSTESPNVVHMSVRPQDLDEEEPKAGGKHQSGSGGDSQRTRSGGCCVIL